MEDQEVEAMDGSHLDIRFDSTLIHSAVLGAPQMVSAVRRVST